MGRKVNVKPGDFNDGRQPGEADRRLASFPQMNPNPVLELDAAGSFIFTNPATLKILRSLGVNEDPRLFLPTDIDNILTSLREHKEEQFFREITIGDRVFEENIYTTTEQGSVRIYAIDVTEHKRSDEALQSHRKLLETVVNHMPAAVALLRGSDLQLQLVNPAYQAIAPGKQMVGRTFDELWPETGQNFTAICRRVLETGKPYLVVDEMNMIRRTTAGPLEKAYFSWSLHRVRLSGQGAWGLLNVAWETTERKRTEEELQKSEARLQLAMEVGNVAAWEVDCVTDVLTPSPQMFRLFGLEPAAGFNMRDQWRALVLEEDRELLRRTIEEATRTGRSYRLDYRLRLPNGDVRWHEAAGRPLLDERGRAHHLVGVLLDITDRKQVEEALRRSNSFNQSIIDSSSDCIKTLDMEGRLQYMSSGGQHLLGIRDIGKYLNVPYEEFWKGSDREAVIEVIHKAKQGQAGSFRGFCPTTDGTPKWWDVSISPVLGADGRPERLLAVSRDITDRIRAEETLLRLNKALKALSDSSQAVIRARNEQHYMDEVCRIVVHDCGYSMVWIGFAEQNEARSIRPVAYAGFDEGYLETLHLTWADTERGRGPTGTAIRTGKISICRNMLIDPDFAPWREEALRRGYASSIVLPLRSESGVFGAITIYSKEVDPFTEDEVKLLTELADNLAYGINVLRIRAAQQVAEESLAVSEEKFALAFANNPAAVALTRLDDGVFLDVNDTWVAVNGYGRDEVIGRSARKLPIWPTAGAAARFVQELRERGSLNGWEQEFRKKSGDLFLAQLSAQVLTIRGEQVILTTFVDVTDRKRAERALENKTRELEELNWNLEKRVEDELGARRKNEHILVQQSKLAAMGEMISAIAHQWRQPLNVVSLTVQNMQEAYEKGRLDAAYLDKAVDKTMAQIEHMSRTIDDFRNFIVPDKEKHDFDAMAALNSVLSLLSTQLSADSIVVRCTSHTRGEIVTGVTDIGSCPERTISGYQNEFEHVLFNLVNNARDAIRERRRSDKRDSPPEGMLCFDFYNDRGRIIIEVNDNGGGIPPELLDRIFEPYFTTKEAVKGTGIGLYMSKVIIEEHLNGTLTAKNSAEGATFTISLPQAPPQEAT